MSAPILQSSDQGSPLAAAENDSKAAVISQVIETFPDIILARAQYLAEHYSTRLC